MVPPNQLFDDLQKNLSELIAKSPAADIERNLRALMQQAFTRMDLVTREEFDVQVQLLSRAMARIQALETRVDALENGGQPPAAAPSSNVDDPAS